jgi:hypothetical protein
MLEVFLRSPYLQQEQLAENKMTKPSKSAYSRDE